MLRTGANTDTPLSRTWIDPKGRPRVQEDETEFLRATTCGLRMLGAGRPEDGDSEGGDDEALYLIPLLVPDNRTRGDDGKRILRLHINFDSAVSMSFSDESGTLIITSDIADSNSEEGSEESVERSIVNQVLHIFQY